MNFIKKNPVLSYFLITFIISWGAILLLIALSGMPTTVAEAKAQLPVAIVTFLFGPLIPGLLMTGLIDGRSGFRDLLSRLFKWRVNLTWYAVALLTAPVVFVAVHYLLSLFSPVYLPGFLTAPNGSSVILLSIMSGIMVGICEEIGWFGFVIPKLRLRYSVLMTGLMVGFVWGAGPIPKPHPVRAESPMAGSILNNFESIGLPPWRFNSFFSSTKSFWSAPIFFKLFCHKMLLKIISDSDATCELKFSAGH